MTPDPFQYHLTKLWFNPVTDLCVGYFQNDITFWKKNEPDTFTVEGSYELPSVKIFDPIGYSAKGLINYAKKYQRTSTNQIL